jgi:hypothetical protein
MAVLSILFWTAGDGAGIEGMLLDAFGDMFWYARPLRLSIKFIGFPKYVRLGYYYLAMFHKRKYTPLFPEKYSGDPTNIIMRSSWETQFANWCDKNPSVKKWKSEETIVPYRCPTDNKIHRYFVDFQIQILDKSGATKTYLIEVKPQNQTVPPVFPGKKTQRYLLESLTFLKNQAKWQAAHEYAKDRGWEFKIITEYELGLKQPK